MKVQVLFTLLFFVIYVNASCSLTQMPLAQNRAGYCSSIWYSGLSRPRGIIALSNNDLLVVEANSARISVLWENAAGVVQKAIIANASGINHGIAVSGGFLYASSASTVYRWPFTVGTRTALGVAQTVVTGIPSTGHTTRTLIFKSGVPNILYVSVGSGPNVDTSTARSGVYTFNVSLPLPIAYSARGTFSRGNRNEVGLRFDAAGQLWGVENGADNLNRADLGGDIHNGNPGEEINALGGNAFYGYPYCWSQYNLTTVTTPRGTQWAWPDFISTFNDAWCRNTTNNKRPNYLLPAHTAPLDIIFKGSQNFPGINSGDAIVSEHGSWNSNPQVGYLVTQVTFTGGLPTADNYLLRYQGPGATGSGWHRPVSLAFGKVQGSDALFVTSDTTNVIIAITSTTNCTCV